MDSKKIIPVDFSRLKRGPLGDKKHKVTLDRQAGKPVAGATLEEFCRALPGVLAADAFRSVVEALVEATRDGRDVVLACGAHVIKCGLSPLLNELMQRKLVSLIALNGAGAIHDAELAMVGSTSEDVMTVVKDGSFGMARETGAFYGRAVEMGTTMQMGLGEALGMTLIQDQAPYCSDSVLAQAVATGTPITVHCAIGTDTVHTFPEVDPSGLGALTHYDFRLFCGCVNGFEPGTVYLNVGSAVILPEVFLKAVGVAKNMGRSLEGLTRVNMDMIQHYRPRENVLGRINPDENHRCYALTGHHEIMLPLLVWSWLNGIS
ncbi:MAG: hypothetical protein QGH40_14050 [bacterium]|nr:hypothetical protein [bacterium]